jgi:hypothetical protein
MKVRVKGRKKAREATTRRRAKPVEETTEILSHNGRGVLLHRRMYLVQSMSKNKYYTSKSDIKRIVDNKKLSLVHL